MMEVMSLTRGFSLVIFILLCHNVVLQSPETGESSSSSDVDISKEMGSGEQIPTETGEAEPEEQIPTDSEEAEAGEQIPTETEETEPGEQIPTETEEAEPGEPIPIEKGETEPGEQIPTEKGEAEPGEQIPTEKGDAEPGEVIPIEKGNATSKEEIPVPKEKPKSGEKTLTSEEEESSEGSEESSNSVGDTILGKKPATFRWPSGTVPYHIKRQHYDSIISARIRAAMKEIERSSCVIFKNARKDRQLKNGDTPWLSIENHEKRRECSHTTFRELGPTRSTKAILTLGYDCMQYRDILHALLHALGFVDEVTHPQRDKYVRIVWPNIKPEYRPLFYVKKSEIPQTMVEYDSMSVMHFHDRAYTTNGKATIVSQIPGLLIAPSDTLSQLDVMKLRLTYGHVCNKRKVADLLQTCQNALTDGH